MCQPNSKPPTLRCPLHRAMWSAQHVTLAMRLALFRTGIIHGHMCMNIDMGINKHHIYIIQLYVIHVHKCINFMHTLHRIVLALVCFVFLYARTYTALRRRLNHWSSWGELCDSGALMAGGDLTLVGPFLAALAAGLAPGSCFGEVPGLAAPGLGGWIPWLLDRMLRYVVRLYQCSALLGHQEEGHEEGPGESRREERSVTGQWEGLCDPDDSTHSASRSKSATSAAISWARPGDWA